MDKSNVRRGNDNNKVKVVSINDYKEKVQKKAKQVKEFEEGPQSLEGCTCGQHTDMNQILTEDIVTEHYLKDRKRYVKGLEGEDPMEVYMESFKSLTGNVPLVRISPVTDLASKEHEQKYFNKGMKFYEQYIRENQDLTYEAEIIAEELKVSYEEYKKHLVLWIRGIYTLEKLDFIRENSDFAGKQVTNFPEKETFESNIGKTEGYIEYINECFSKLDDEISRSVTAITSKTLNMIIDKKLNGDIVTDEEIKVLGHQIKISLQLIEKRMIYSREVVYKNMKKRFNEIKGDCSVEYKAELLIDLELRGRQIDGYYDYADKSEFTVNNSIEQLIEIIGIENAIGKLSTKELETLLEQFKLLKQ